MTFDQAEYDIRLEWGSKGVELLAPISDIIIIVDILSFSTCVEIANSNGAIIFPYGWKDETAIIHAERINAIMADYQVRKLTGGYSLSPTSLLNIPKDTRLVLPSPNGSTLSLSTGETLTICGCLRNAQAVARYAQAHGKTIAIIPAGERWEDKTLRPSFEDLVGAGAIISYLNGRLSPESKAAVAAFYEVCTDLENEIVKCSSGKELIERGFKKDVLLASTLNASETVPILIDQGYRTN